MDNMGFVLDYLARWGHFLFGIAWIGLLYYFNFVQGEYFKEADASARVDVFSKLVPRAMWYFRWAAAFTFLTGVYDAGVSPSGLDARHHGWRDARHADVPQRVADHLAESENHDCLQPTDQRGWASVTGGGSCCAEGGSSVSNERVVLDPDAVLHGCQRALRARRLTADKQLALIVALVIIAALELNAIFGKQGPLVTVRGVIVSGLALTVVLWAVVQLL